MIVRATPLIYGPEDAIPAPLSVEEMFKRWKDTKKPSRIAASFQKIDDLTEEHTEHFKTYEYLWKPMQGNIWGGVWLNDDIPYIHLVLATIPVVEHCLNLRPGSKVKIVEEQGPTGPTYTIKQEAA